MSEYVKVRQDEIWNSIAMIAGLKLEMATKIAKLELEIEYLKRENEQLRTRPPLQKARG